MFAKVHPAKDVQSSNTGSCHDLVHYLQKEGDTGLAFFSHTDNDVSPEKVITDIDGNRSKLGSDEAKFYMLSLNPSQAEQVHLKSVRLSIASWRSLLGPQWMNMPVTFSVKRSKMGAT